MNLKLILILIIANVLFVEKVCSLECYACDSNEDPECATKPGQQIAVEECASETDECVQVIVSGITRRGCLSRLFPSKYCPEPCERCSRSLCNRDIFPRDRLRCFQCTGANCVKVENKPELILPCPFYHADDRCYTNVIHASNVYRGCEKTNLPLDCPHVCLKCNRDGCNNEPGLTEQNCLLCKHSSISPDWECWRGQDPLVTSRKCVASPAKYCQNKNLYGHQGKCFTYINEQTGIAERGCSSNKGFYPSGNLTECYGENCNNGCLTISCNVCSSKDNANCITGKSLRSEKCPDSTSSCFSCEEGNHVTRGCADADTLSKLQRNSNAVCQFCNSESCNRYSVRTCHSCSSLQDENCALMSNLDAIEQRNCSAANDLCVSTVLNKLDMTYVLRDCASRLDECTDNDPLCVRCNGTLCNSTPIDLSNFAVNQLSKEVEKSKVVDFGKELNLFEQRNGGQQATSWQLSVILVLFAVASALFS